MEESLRLFRVPGELDYLASPGQALSASRSRRDVSPWLPPSSGALGLSGAAAHRLGGLARDERDQANFAVAHPDWLGGMAVPRLIITAKYPGWDAFGASRLVADLDLAVRRAAALHRRLLQRDQIESWPAPVRTHHGGLRLLDAQVGSFEVLMTVWGTLVAVATSSPIAVAGLIALAVDVSRGAVHLTNRWVGAIRPSSKRNDQPSLGPLDSAVPWGIQHTKALTPVLKDAVAKSQGFEFFLDENGRTIKLTVLPAENSKGEQEE